MSLWDRLMSFFHISRKRAVPYVAPAIVAPTLAALGLSSASFTVGTTASGTITGATLASVLTISGAPTGFTINSAARTWAYDGTGSPASGNLTLTETLAGAIGNPKATAIAYTVADFITAIVVTNVSSGLNPPTFDLDNGDPVTGFAIGDYIHLQWATNSTFTTGVGNDYHLVTSDDVILGDTSFATWTNLPVGALYYRFRAERGGTAGVSGYPGTDSVPAVFGAWTTTLNDTMPTPIVAAFTASTTAPPNYTGAVSSASFTTDFLVGNGIAQIGPVWGGKTIASITATPVGGGTAIAGVQRFAEASGDAFYTYSFPITTAGNYVIAITLSGGTSPIQVSFGTLTVGNPTPVGNSVIRSPSVFQTPVAGPTLTIGTGETGVVHATIDNNTFLGWTNVTARGDNTVDGRVHIGTMSATGAPTVRHSGTDTINIYAVKFAGA